MVGLRFRATAKIIITVSLLRVGTTLRCAYQNPKFNYGIYLWIDARVIFAGAVLFHHMLSFAA